MFGKWLTDKSCTKQTTGAWVEHQARQWLTQQGLLTIESNYHCKLGEIDIVMLDQQQLVFVEVRYRKQARFGNPAETVDWRKQKKLMKTAAHYLLHHPKHNQRACRFDVLAAQPADREELLHWTWIRDAFTA